MGTTSSVNLGVANLLQDLTNVGSPLASSPTAVAALEKAPPSDIVQLSAEASQLQGLEVLFGQTNTDTTATSNQSAANSILSALYPDGSSPGSTPTPIQSLYQALENASPGTSGATGGTASSSSLTQAVASYQSNLQSDEIQSMFGD
ncbi:MAG: hypothetical protein ABSH09_24765 [Bryobacteraceae bacterium]|jgi:hypothetical protein